MPIKTLGLTHIALKVTELEQTKTFYQDVFGMQVMYSDDKFLQMQTPGCSDIVVFEKGDPHNGNTGGIIHFGFRLQTPEDIIGASKLIETSGGEIIDEGEFVPGEPYIFFKYPDQYKVKLVFDVCKQG